LYTPAPEYGLSTRPGPPEAVRFTVIDAPVMPDAAAANVDVAAVVPAAAVNVTFTPVDQLPVVRVTVPGLEVITVLPLRVSVTTTLPLGADESRTFDVPVAPPAIFSVAGFTTMELPVVAPSTVNGINAVDVDNGGVALSNAVACAV
jgi:hypothetical protein